MIEHRYEERGDRFTLQSWHKGHLETVRQRKDHAPSWLQRIVEVARVGGYIKKVESPPPDAILWFETDDNCELISFNSEWIQADELNWKLNHAPVQLELDLE